MHTQERQREGVVLLGVRADQLYSKLEGWCSYSDPSICAAIHACYKGRFNAIGVAPWWLRQAAQPCRGLAVLTAVV